MKQFQIENLRDFAIEHLPRAQADKEQVDRYGGTAADLNNRLAVTATMVRGKAPAGIERVAANILESVTLLCADRNEVPISKAERASLLQSLASEAQDLCTLTGKVIPWLASLPTVPEPEPEQEEASAPTIQKPMPKIGGSFLTTKEAAEVLGYKEQTLRAWASNESGPIQPIRTMGRHLRWSGDDILALQSRKKS